ncbi:autoinducer binding domain-containing protein [uncultured Roseibium sp.]|uniref:autoinducer binding domain-containing protein n=1 Tax=uncultured Roseibium sp. TaxID=1936171 RepID=UPI0026370368|nr:autoinducer binding domain-containing protein [uncultured Roseibium sp.]
MNFLRLLDNLSSENNERESLDHVLAEFEELEPFCAFFCSAAPLKGSHGVRDKVDHGRTIGDFVNNQVLQTVLNNEKILAADKFPEYCKYNHKPLLWQCDPVQIEDLNERALSELAADFGITHGITVPIHQLNRTTYGNFTLFFNNARQRQVERLRPCGQIDSGICFGIPDLISK